MARIKTPAPPIPTPSSKRMKKSLSIIASFDELVRNCSFMNEEIVEKQFLEFVKEAEEWRRRWSVSESECTRLRDEVTNLSSQIRGKEVKIRQARNIVEKEVSKRHLAENERDVARKQIKLLRDILLNSDNGGVGGGQTFLNNETREKIRLLEQSEALGFGHSPGNLNLVVEESADSILDASDLSYDETVDGANNTSLRVRQNKRRSHLDKSARNRRRTRSNGNVIESSGTERIVATTTVSVINGQAHAESIIEASGRKGDTSNNNHVDVFEEKAKKSRRSREERRVTYNDHQRQDDVQPSAPPSEDYWSNCILSPLSPVGDGSPLYGSPYTPLNPVKRTFSNAGNIIPSRPHHLVRKKIFKEEDCGPCGGKIKMGRSRIKCRDCGATAHTDCKDSIPLPCLPSNLTPSRKPGNYLSDYTSLISPMIPGLLIHCIQEIEARGLSEVGLYRVPGPEKESQELLQRFMRNKGGAPNLSKIDINTISSCVKKFLRCLKEPLIPQSLWKRFVDAAENPDSTDAESALYQCISELPQPNRDTMAYMIIHLQKVAQSSDCKMGGENLARVFGPTIVGYSSTDPANVLTETPLQKLVMMSLMSLSTDYWRTFVSFNDENFPGSRNLKTPGDTTSGGFLNTPLLSSERKFKKLQKKNLYFQSPILYKY